MNKRTKLISAWLLPMALTLGACSQDDDQPRVQEQPSVLNVSVRDKGFDYDGPLTRISYSEATTTLQAGDTIGVYVARDGAFVERIVGETGDLMANKPFVYDGQGWRQVSLVEGDTETKDLLYYPGATYFAYYPYNATEQYEPNPAATDTAEDFFATKIDAWYPSQHQSTPLAYRRNDLMVARGVLEASSLTFTLIHKMALVQLGYDKTTHTIANFQPWEITSNQHRLLVKPLKEYWITGSIYSSATHSVANKTGTWDVHVLAGPYSDPENATDDTAMRPGHYRKYTLN